MVQLRSAEADRFIENPDPGRPWVLLYGPDSGAVAERADALAKGLAGGDALALSRFDESELASTPGHLSDEVGGVSLFSDRRVIRIRAGGPKSIAGELKSLMAESGSDVFVIVEAGDLRKSSPLRKLFEAGRNAVAIGCYPDNEAALGRLIDREVADAGLVIEADARALLVAQLGADRAASRAEIEKLCLYAKEAGAITARDVAELVGDGAAFAIDDLVNAVAAGEVISVERSYRQLLLAGVHSAAVGAAVERHFLQLHRLRSTIDAGASPSAALQGMRPPPFPSRRAALERQLSLWRTERLGEALTRLEETMIQSRLHPAIADAIIGRTLLALASAVARRSRQPA